MAIDRTSTIQNLYSGVTGSAPTPTDLEFGEIAINIADKKIYFRGSDDSLNTLTAGDAVTSFNGATGAVEKIYGCFYNGTGVTFSTAQTTIPLDTVMYNSDPAGLTLSSNRIQINKGGTFKITADLAVGLTGTFAPGSLLVVESQMFKKSGILSPTAVNGTKMYHTIERQNPNGSTTVTTEFTVPANASCTMITNGHASGNSYLLQSIQYWDSGTGLNGNYFSVPAECYRITVEEL